MLYCQHHGQQVVVAVATLTYLAADDPSYGQSYDVCEQHLRETVSSAWAGWYFHNNPGRDFQSQSRPPHRRLDPTQLPTNP